MIQHAVNAAALIVAIGGGTEALTPLLGDAGSWFVSVTAGLALAWRIGHRKV